MEKVCENLVSSLSALKVNSKTKLLLEQAHEQAEELKSQEEERQQNMEELSATQEEMARKEREYIKKIERLELALKKQKAEE